MSHMSHQKPTGELLGQPHGNGQRFGGRAREGGEADELCKEDAPGGGGGDGSQGDKEGIKRFLKVHGHGGNEEN